MSDTAQLPMGTVDLPDQLTNISNAIVKWLDQSRLPERYDRDMLREAVKVWLEETSIDEIAKRPNGRGDTNDIFARNFAFIHGGTAARANVPLAQYLANWVDTNLRLGAELSPVKAPSIIPPAGGMSFS